MSLFRTDPLISHRTTTTSEEGEITDPYRMDASTSQERQEEEKEDVKSSGRLSSELNSSKASYESSGYCADEEGQELNLFESDEANDQLDQEEEEDKTPKDADLQSQKEDSDKIQEVVGEKPGVGEEVVPPQNNAKSSTGLTDDKLTLDSEFHEQLNSLDNIRTTQKISDNDESASLPRLEEENDQTAQLSVSTYENASSPQCDVSTDLPDHRQEQNVIDESNHNAGEPESDSGKATEEYSESDSFPSESITPYHSMTESEADMLSDSSPVRIVVTSARKVERELLERRPSIEILPTPSPQNEAGNGISRQSVAAQTEGEYIEDADEESRMITREDVTAVTSLSRPQSGRPIPSVAEVKDPFVDFVASTRQKQVERSVDVQAIFSGAQGKNVVDRWHFVH